jgi:hypothetical protein
MSATTEGLLEEIRNVEDELSRNASPSKAAEHALLSEKLKELRTRFNACSEALTENRQLLKD